MASMIYGVSRNGTRGIGYDYDEEYDCEKDDKPNTLQTYFVSSGKKNGFVPKGRTVSKSKAKAKPHSCFNHEFRNKYPSQKTKFVKNSGKTNLKGPRKMWVPKDMIIYISLAAELRHRSWYLDSGYSEHVTGRRQMFQSLELKHEGVVDF
ncbi:uncharacterized protein LOC127104794 [Lathyrus oleraceus]|uniref:uncharacterized protein LOC127104794 n=1 Tax=Pisum sativum TaxID=3888 RepID=UPI0021CE6C7B|nr:uncharacterized protein LOC127104794 [Pisum sativum]